MSNLILSLGQDKKYYVKIKHGHLSLALFLWNLINNLYITGANISISLHKHKHALSKIR